MYFMEKRKENNMQNIKIDGYDEYVKDFEEKCNNSDVHPVTEEEILEFVTEACESHGVTSVEEMEEYEHVLEQENSVDGQEHKFCFIFEADDDGQVVMRYVSED